MKTAFDAFEEGKERSAEHAQEIISSRVGGFGGSDAALFLKIGLDGNLSTLSTTELNRIAVAMGLEQPKEFGGNKYTKAGHQFEDYVGKMSVMEGMEREKYLSAELAGNFKTFAHADFASEDGKHIVECKYVTTKTTEQVRSTYLAQLQWYYLIGAERVTLLHGTGLLDDQERGTSFEVQHAEFVKVERNDDTIEVLRNGIRILDEAISGGWKPVTKVDASVDDAPDAVRLAYVKLSEAKELAAKAKALESESRTVLRDYMTDWGYGSLSCSDGHTVMFVAGKTSSRFDLAQFKAGLSAMAEDADEATMQVLIKVRDLIDKSTKKVVIDATLMFK